MPVVDGSAPITLSPLHMVRTHVIAERGNSVPAILDTVSRWDQHFAVASRSGRNLVLKEAHDLETVREFYEETRRSFEIHSAQHLTKVSGSWYTVIEAIGHLDHIGELGGVPATGKTIHNPTVVIFPTWSDGIIGEISWWRHDVADVIHGRAVLPASPAAAYPHNDGGIERAHTIHERWIHTWATNDVAARLALFDDGPILVVDRTAEVDGPRRTRAILRDQAALEAHLTAAESGRIEDIQVLNLVCATWYIFSETLLTVVIPEGKRQRRHVALYPINQASGRLMGELSYALDFCSSSSPGDRVS